MPSEPVKGLPSFWSTTISKVIVGDQPCLLSAWLSGHTDLIKRERDDGQLANWKVDHTAQLRAVAERFRSEGWKVDLERFFRVKGQAAIVSGKCDIVAQQTDKRPLIADIKSGRPRDSDVAQVLLEMVLLPLAWSAPHMQFAGQVIYPTHTVDLTPVQAAAFKPKLVTLLRKLGTMPRPSASPSRDACRFCDVTEADCTDRFVQPEDAETQEF